MKYLSVYGAKKHNLKHINLKIPRNKLIVITGVSGSGKSSLAYDTIFQEGQRRYLESLSNYARQFIKSIEKPEVQTIRGISPTISIDQKHSSFHFNSTVGTVSEVNQYLRLLFSKVSIPHCPVCKREIKTYDSKKIINLMFSRYKNKKIKIFSPIIRGRKGNFNPLLKKFLRMGYLKVLIDNELKYIEDIGEIDRYKKHDLYLLIDVIDVVQDNKDLISDAISIALSEGNNEVVVEANKRKSLYSSKIYCSHCNISLNQPQPATFSFNSPIGACKKCNGSGILDNKICSYCNGSGLNEEALSFYFHNKNIFEIESMEIKDALNFFKGIKLNREEKIILKTILSQIIGRLEAFVKLNLGYLSLNRKIYTISGGELQRSRLVSQLGSGLTGIIYVLDEPSIGIHLSEHLNLLKILRKFKENGNTIIIVEHDKNTIVSSDYVVDLGPLAGERGGELIYSGWFKDFKNAENSLTSDYIYKRKRLKYYEKKSKRELNEFFVISGIEHNNLKGITVKIPINSLTVVTGVSGSGKSSLVTEAVFNILSSLLMNKKSDIKYKKIKGYEAINRVLKVDQTSIGKTSRSCPATYINVMPLIRELYAALEESRMRGYSQSRFSFNVEGGRCEACKGLGFKTIEMSFLPKFKTTCSVCSGKRYNSETLKIRYKGYSIADVLEMTVNEAYELFLNIPYISKKLKTLIDVGLGYLKLGQGSGELSGGESQRIKLTKEISKISSKKTLYILDEPTIGLHFYDIQKLIDIFNILIKKGNSVVVIEHNPDIIKAADYIIDLGPEGGKFGGEVVFQGHIDEFKEFKDSKTSNLIEWN